MTEKAYTNTQKINNIKNTYCKTNSSSLPLKYKERKYNKVAAL